MIMDTTPDKNFKIVVIGDPQAGKSSLVKRYVNNTFSSTSKATPGCDFILKIVKWGNGINLRLHFWDIAGQEKSARSMRMYFREAAGAIVVFDQSQPGALERIREWKEILDSGTPRRNVPTVPTILLANKCDMPPAEETSRHEVEDLSRQLGFDAFFETSAKANINVKEAFGCLVDELMENETALKGHSHQLSGKSSSILKLGRINGLRCRPNSGCFCT